MSLKNVLEEETAYSSPRHPTPPELFRVLPSLSFTEPSPTLLDTGTLAADITGTVIVEETSSGISMTGTVGGLEASVSSVGVHIHSGVICASTSMLS